MDSNYGPIRDNGYINAAGKDLVSGTSKWLYAVTALMAVSGLVIGFMTLRRPRGTRVFHHLALMILFTTTVAYWTMASDLGKTPVRTSMRELTTRAIWYVRYIDWVITGPLLLLTILLGTGLPLSDIVTACFFFVFFAVNLLIGALVSSNYKWGYFTMGVLALLWVVYHVLGPARASVRSLGVTWASAYTRSAGLLMFVWMLYPICWGLSEGGNVLRISGEHIFYGVLDILAKPVFLFVHLMAVSKLDYSNLGLNSGKYSEPYHAGGTLSAGDLTAPNTAHGVNTAAHPEKRGGMFGRNKAPVATHGHATTAV